MNILYSPQFLRAFKKIPQHIQEAFREKEKVFYLDHFAPKLKTHKLKGRIEWSFSVTYEIRVIFIFHEGNIILINIGDHSVYK